ncbi:MAG: hypothetical protein JSR82_12365 [Verrucomicrobia bacterium]|nr:hypothetical protein [Verrucomicrobiota bacterium]
MPSDPRRLLVLGLAIGTLSFSGLMLMLHAFTAWKVAASITILAPLTVVLGLACWALARAELRPIFLQRLWGGAFAGFIGLIAYDGLRWLILISGTVPFNPFKAIENFGLLILATDVPTVTTKTVGWLFHTWNGLSFGAMYTLAFGRGGLVSAVIWALILELAMIVTYPTLFRVQLDWAFLSISIAGHIAFGLAVGWTARRVVEQ